MTWEYERRWRALWKSEKRLLRDYDPNRDDVVEWRRQHGRQTIERERAAYLVALALHFG
jgi:hypothetical protein